MNSSKAASERANPEEAKKNLASISPFFIVKDLQASISHYIERFGFKLDFQGPPDDVYYGQVSRDGMGIMLKAILPDVLPCPNHTRHEWARWDAYSYTLDPAASVKDLVIANAGVQTGPTIATPAASVFLRASIKS